MKLTIHALSELPEAAKTFLSSIGEKKIIAFYGTMGAGKTTFIKALCQLLGVNDVVNSPTFSVVNEYQTATGENIFHFDFYRINKIEEAYDFGYEDYFFSGNYCFIEWSEKIEEILPDDCVKVHIQETPCGNREISFHP